MTDLEGALYRLLGDNVCHVELDARSYSAGDIVTAVRFEVRNLLATPTALTVTLSLRAPDGSETPLARGGFDESLVLPGDTSQDDGPLALFSVTEDFAPGAYAAVCCLGIRRRVSYGARPRHRSSSRKRMGNPPCLYDRERAFLCDTTLFRDNDFDIHRGGRTGSPEKRSPPLSAPKG